MTSTHRGRAARATLTRLRGADYAAGLTDTDALALAAAHGATPPAPTVDTTNEEPA